MNTTTIEELSHVQTYSFWFLPSWRNIFWYIKLMRFVSYYHFQFIKRGNHERLKANSHIACRAHTAPMPFPCHAVPLRVQILSFPFDLHSATVFDSHTPCHVHAAPMPCPCRTPTMPFWKRLLNATAQHDRSMAWARRDMCESALRMWMKRVLS
jgi:hypothetical protein